MTDFNQYLKKEGISPNSEKAQFLGAIYGQESGSGRNTRTSNQGAVGGMQIIPSTFASVADKGWDINNPEQSTRAGIRYGSQLYDKYGAERAAVGYYSGDKGVEAYDKGVYYRDKKNPNAPNTKEYAQAVLGRMGGGGAGGAGGGGEDYSFETIMKDYKPPGETVPKTVSKTVPPEDYSFETIMKDYKPPGETVPKTVGETVPKTVSETPIVDTARMGVNSLVKGAAGSADAILNLPENLTNLGTAGYGVAANKLFGVPSEQLPTVEAPKNIMTNYLTNTGLISNDQQLMPTSAGGRVADTVLQGIGSGTGFSKNLLQTAGMAGAAAVGQGVTEATGNPLLGIAAGIVAPTAAKGALTAATAGGAALKNIAVPTQVEANKQATKMVYNYIADDIQANFPNVKRVTPSELAESFKNQNIFKDAVNLEQKVINRADLPEEFATKTDAEILKRAETAQNASEMASIYSREVKKNYQQLEDTQFRRSISGAIGTGAGIVGGVVDGAVTGGVLGILTGASIKGAQKMDALKRQRITTALSVMDNPEVIAQNFKNLSDAAKVTFLDNLAELGKTTTLKAARGQIPVANKLTQQQD